MHFSHFYRSYTVLVLAGRIAFERDNSNTEDILIPSFTIGATFGEELPRLQQVTYNSVSLTVHCELLAVWPHQSASMLLIKYMGALANVWKDAKLSALYIGVARAFLPLINVATLAYTSKFLFSQNPGSMFLTTCFSVKVVRHMLAQWHKSTLWDEGASHFIRVSCLILLYRYVVAETTIILDGLWLKDAMHYVQQLARYTSSLILSWRQTTFHTVFPFSFSVFQASLCISLLFWSQSDGKIPDSSLWLYRYLVFLV